MYGLISSQKTHTAAATIWQILLIRRQHVQNFGMVAYQRYDGGEPKNRFVTLRIPRELVEKVHHVLLNTKLISEFFKVIVLALVHL